MLFSAHYLNWSDCCNIVSRGKHLISSVLTSPIFYCSQSDTNRQGWHSKCMDLLLEPRGLAAAGRLASAGRQCLSNQFLWPTCEKHCHFRTSQLGRAFGYSNSFWLGPTCRRFVGDWTRVWIEWLWPLLNNLDYCPTKISRDLHQYYPNWLRRLYLETGCRNRWATSMLVFFSEERPNDVHHTEYEHASRGQSGASNLTHRSALQLLAGLPFLYPEIFDR